MYKKLLIPVVFFFIGLFVTVDVVYSQEPPQETVKLSFDQVYAEYVGYSDEYNKAHADYVLKRSQFLNFQSLKSRQDAYDATLVLLEKRDEVVIAYLKVLRIKIEEGLGVPDARKEGLLFRIDEEINWYTFHKENLSTTGSLDDLVADSKLAANRWQAMDPLAYEVMSVLSQGKVMDFTERSDKLFSETKDKLELIRDDEREGYSFSSSKFQVLDRWTFEADGKIVRSKEKQTEAEIMIGGFTKIKRAYDSHYNSIVSKLTEAQIFLKEANLFLKEVVRQIKTEE